MEDVDDGVLLIFIHTSRALKECAQTNRNKKASADGGSVRERERAGGGERSRRERERKMTRMQKSGTTLCILMIFSVCFAIFPPRFTFSSPLSFPYLRSLSSRHSQYGAFVYFSYHFLSSFNLLTD